MPASQYSQAKGEKNKPRDAKEVQQSHTQSNVKLLPRGTDTFRQRGEREQI